MARVHEGDKLKTCPECGKVLGRYLDFAPRWGRCERHKKLKPKWDPKCSECVRLRGLRTRQPRCFTCDEARKERLGIEGRLKRECKVAGLSRKNIRRTDASALVVRVFGLAKAKNPTALLERLTVVAEGKVRLMVVEPFVSPPSQKHLMPPPIVEQLPEDARTFAAVWDLRAAAGPFTFAAASGGLLGYMDTGQRTRRDDFIVQVRGESMEPEIPSGSYCVFKKEKFGPSLNGKIVLAQRLDGEAEDGAAFTVKTLRIGSDPSRVELEPTNSSFPTIEVHEGEDVTILGVLRRLVELPE